MFGNFNGAKFKRFANTVREQRKQNCVDMRDRVGDHLYDSLSSQENGIQQINAVKGLWWLTTTGYKVRDVFCFRLLEVIASEDTYTKSIGYKALAQTTPVGHDGLFLVTNIVQKDLNGPDPRAALEFLANVRSSVIHECTISSLTALLVNSKVDIRKKAIIALHTSYKLGCIEIGAVAEHLRTILDDENISTVIAAVTFLIECASKEGRQCLVFGPACLILLKKTSSVMLQSRLIRFLEILSRVESRIYAKLEPVLLTYLDYKNMKVVRYGSAQALLSYFNETDEIMPQILTTMDEFLEGTDHNLRYCGLDLLEKLFQSLLNNNDLTGVEKLVSTKFLQIEKMLASDTACFVVKILNLLPSLLPVLAEDESLNLIRPLKKSNSAVQHTAVFIPPILSVVKSLNKPRLLQGLLEVLQDLGHDLPESILYCYLKNLKVSAKDFNGRLDHLLIEVIPLSWCSSVPSFAKEQQLVANILSDVVDDEKLPRECLRKYIELCRLISILPSERFIPIQARWKSMWKLINWSQSTENCLDQSETNSVLVRYCTERQIRLPPFEHEGCRECGLTKSNHERSVHLGSGSSFNRWVLVDD